MHCQFLYGQKYSTLTSRYIFWGGPSIKAAAAAALPEILRKVKLNI
jgi:hypothetical protein